jgi:glutamate/tyrosine decarboxylase-like PLP-dependent enzyme
MKTLLQKTCDIAIDFLESLPGREVGRPVDYSALLATMGGNLPQNGEDPLHVIEHLTKTTASALVASPGPRYFGFVIGGSVPAALAADWLTSTWDQNAVLFVSSPAAAAAEEISRRWVLNLLGLPVEMTAGFTTSATMANFTALAAARHAMLKQGSWDVEERGLFNAPEIAVAASEESHVTIFASLQMLGLGRSRIIKIATDGQGRMRPDALRHALADLRGPLVVCAQAGNVNLAHSIPSDAFTADVIRRVQEDGTCWAGGTTWHKMHALRIAVSNWSTTEADIDASADAILRYASDSTQSAQAK